MFALLLQPEEGKDQPESRFRDGFVSSVGRCVLRKSLVRALQLKRKVLRETFISRGSWAFAKWSYLPPKEAFPYLHLDLHRSRLLKKVNCLDPPG